MKLLFSAIVVSSLVGFQKAPGVTTKLEPKLTLIEEQEAKRNNLDTWIVDQFEFLPPRMITVDVPGKGRRLLLYLVYKVTNKGEKPRFFLPDLVIVDNKGNVVNDTIVPKAQRAIQAREDPLRPLKNSVTIMGQLAPSSSESRLTPADRVISCPTSELPVNETFRTRRSRTRASPTWLPLPVRVWIAVGGIPASRSLAVIQSAVSGA